MGEENGDNAMEQRRARRVPSETQNPRVRQTVIRLQSLLHLVPAVAGALRKVQEARPARLPGCCTPPHTVQPPPKFWEASDFERSPWGASKNAADASWLTPGWYCPANPLTGPSALQGYHHRESPRSVTGSTAAGLPARSGPLAPDMWIGTLVACLKNLLPHPRALLACAALQPAPHCRKASRSVPFGHGVVLQEIPFDARCPGNAGLHAAAAPFGANIPQSVPGTTGGNQLDPLELAASVEASDGGLAKRMAWI
mmetsp:Transcript_102672/g.257374  ORF Transcript_102672/g.257374 Transcript_102672/m.257374 type:complete len:255 (+) Transcript_102672:1008-1772(+)